MTFVLVLAFLAGTSLPSISAHALIVGPSWDTDGDQIADELDNCLIHPNPTQQDADGDNYGNACDGDLNGNCIVEFSDFHVFRESMFLTGSLAADLDDDFDVDFEDLAVLRESMFTTPGPSGLTDICGNRVE